MRVLVAGFTLLLVLSVCFAGSLSAQESETEGLLPQQFISAEEMRIEGGMPGVGIEFITVHGRSEFESKRIVKRSFLPKIQDDSTRVGATSL